jgi:pyruvate/2-oxoacid:ferredoxin oxidoreductase beta subunit
MNTGGQRSSATTKYAYTTTTPVGEISRGKPERKKNVPLLVAAHNVPYVATASVSFPEDLIGKLRYAQGLEGFRFIHISAPCPTGWGFNPKDTIKVGREMVLSGLAPLRGRRRQDPEAHLQAEGAEARQGGPEDAGQVPPHHRPRGRGDPGGCHGVL